MFKLHLHLFFLGFLFSLSVVSTQPTVCEDKQCLTSMGTSGYFDDDECLSSDGVLDLEKDKLRLTMSLQTERQRVQDLNRRISTMQQSQFLKARARLMDKLTYWPPHGCGVARDDDNIYISSKHFGDDGRIHIFRDDGNFTHVRSVEIASIKDPVDMAYCNVTRSLYLADGGSKQVWKMPLSNFTLTPWLSGLTLPYHLSVSSDGGVLLLNKTSSFTFLNTFRSDATLLKSIQLPSNITGALHAIQTPSGTYFICHKSSGKWVISEISADGMIIKQFPSRGTPFTFRNPIHLSLDPVENRLFVADLSLKMVVMISNDFQLHKVLFDNVYQPRRIFYSPRDTQLIVAQWNGGTPVYEIV